VAKDLVAKDLVAKDLVAKDLVAKDLVAKDQVRAVKGARAQLNLTSVILPVILLH
jgi:hypothetical protein